MRFLGVLVFFAATVHAAPHCELEAYLDDHLVQSGAPSGVAAVSIDGEIVWSWTSGYADLAAERKTTIDTAYSIASVTKPITAVAVMKLVEQGKIDLDAPANRYLPVSLTAAPYDAGDISVRMLLEHTSGLPRHYKFYYADREKPLDGAEFVRRYGRALLPPGEVFEYSNVGYGVLELIIEAVSGREYEEFLHEEIFKPLAMANTFIPPIQKAQGPFAERYREYSRPVPFYDFDHRGASAVFATASDLLRFANGLMTPDESNTIITSESARQMWPKREQEDSYGLGFSVWNLDGELIAHHSGGMPGVAARLMFIPRKRIAVVFMMNAGGGSWNPTTRILREFQPELFATEDAEASAKMIGSWRGSIALGENQSASLELIFDENGRLASGRLDEQALCPTSFWVEDEGYFGLMLRQPSFALGESTSYHHGLRFKIKPAGDRMVGYVTAQERPTRGRIGNAVSYPIKLERTTDLNPLVPELLEAFGVPSVQASLFQGGEIQWTQTFGMQDADHPATNTTLYNAASLTKLVSAELFIRLMEQGQVDLDQSMAEHWIDPDVQDDPRHRQLTPRIAFAHTSGFKNWRRPPYSDGVLRFEFEPGTHYGYSGEGFEYVRRFLERKLDLGFEKLVEHYVFGPAGMTESSFTEKPWFENRLAAPFYSDERFRDPFIYQKPNAAGDLRTTSSDFAEFMLFAMAADGLTPQLADERFRITLDRAEAICARSELPAEACPIAAGRGVGWYVYEYEDEHVLFHTGGNDGLRSLAFYVPERDFGMTLFANGQNGFHVIYPIVEAFYDNARWIQIMRPD